MDRYAMCKDDPYLISGTECLVNILGITDIEELERAEREKTDITSNRIQKQTPPYGLDTMTYIHQTLFCPLYAWAGKVRTVGIWKGNTMFCVPERIEAEASKQFGALNRDFAEKEVFWDITKAADRLAFHYGELNILHPFREGNGRTQRILFEFIADDIGYAIHWPDDRDQWIAANISAYETDHRLLTNIFLDILAPK
ncbi:MAG: Fic family protein [Proteobacteria bacterium]|nr:Fic family protein [Pseudomonadota bacterium]